MSGTLLRSEASRHYNLARARGRSPEEILARCWCALHRRGCPAHARRILQAVAERAEREI